MTVLPLVILLADSDDADALLAHRHLSQARIANRIVRVADGQQVLDYLGRAGAFADLPADAAALLLLALDLSGLGAIEVLARLKADKNMARTPVIILTSTDDPRAMDRCYELGTSVQALPSRWIPRLWWMRRCDWACCCNSSRPSQGQS